MDDLIKIQSDEDEKQNLHPDIKDLPSSFVFPKNLVTMKSTSRNSELGICFGVSQTIGGRSYQEDTFVCVPRLVRSKKDSVAFFAVYVVSFLSPNLDFLTLTQHNNSYDGHNGNRTSTMLRERLHISLAKQIESASSTLNPEKVLIKTFTELDRSYIAEIRVLPKEDVSGST